MNRYGVFSFLLLLLLAACGESHEQMLRQLTELERMNRADSVMQNDTLAEHIVRYFDRHGDANERMRAHYILGRTYADMGELPRALETYYYAADLADTTWAYCDFSTLSRIHAQSADIFHKQIQPRSELKELSLAAYYARKANDTVQAIECITREAGAYKYLNLHDSVILIKEYASRMFREIGKNKRAAQTLGSTITSLIDIGEIDKAKEYLDIYEHESGFFDENGDISSNHEIYYYIKGRYCLCVNRLDSAEFYFRKLLVRGKTLNDAIAGNLGLQEVFSRREISDSVAKYAKTSYELNDSAYSLSEMMNIQRFQASYNYSRHQQHALEMEQLTNKERVRGIIIACLLLFLILLLLFYRWRSVLKMREYKVKMMAYRQMLQKNEADSQGQGKKKHEISQTLYNSSIRKRLLDKISQDECATEEDWQEVSSIILQTCPGFNEALQGFLPSINSTYYRICLGVKLQLSPAQIATLVSRSRQAVASARSRMYKDVFAKNGKPSDFDDFILSLN